MSVRDRLNRLTGEPARKQENNSKNETITGLRRKIDEIMSRRERLVQPAVTVPRARGVPLEQVVSGEEVEMPYGRFFFSRCRFEGASNHGNRKVCDLASLGMEAAGILASSGELCCLKPEDALFLDTETTGLAGGTGTFPFLVGLGWFEAGSFITCQLFARDFSEEKAMLSFLDETAADKRFLVTFNGRAFDVNLLAARFILSRIPDRLSSMPHLDLLHPSRRIFSHRLDNCRLATLEHAVLGFRRQDDIPGMEIPQRYFDWLRRHDGRLLEDVFRHNRFDIISMASLARHLTELLEGKHGGDTHSGDVLSAARFLHERGHADPAVRMYECLLDSPVRDAAQHARRSLSLIRKKSGQWEQAVALWEEMLSCDPDDVFAVEELAKWYEHRRRDFGRAAGLVQGVLGRGTSLGEPERTALEYRLERLLHKAAAHET
jgi:hypothetical protein